MSVWGKLLKPEAETCFGKTISRSISLSFLLVNIDDIMVIP